MNNQQYFPIRSIFLLAVCLFVACEDKEEVEELKQEVEELKQPDYRDAFLGDYKFHSRFHSMTHNMMNPFPDHMVVEGNYDGRVTASGTDEIAIDIWDATTFTYFPTFKTGVSSGGIMTDRTGFFRNDSIFFLGGGTGSSHTITWSEVSGAKNGHEVIDEEEPEQDDSGLTMDCRPTSYKIAMVESATYSYNDSNQVSRISSSSNVGSQVYFFEYNAAGQLGRVRRVFRDGTVDYELIYDGQPKPQKIHRSGDVTVTYHLSYDAEGRLIRRGSSLMDGGPEHGHDRYEYGDDSNVLRHFAEVSLYHPEILARHNFVFDNKPRFYKDHPELEIFYVYIIGGTPGKNNILSYDYYNFFSATYPTPVKVSSKVAYNSIGLIKNCEVHSGDSPLELDFLQMAYECK